MDHTIRGKTTAWQLKTNHGTAMDCHWFLTFSVNKASGPFFHLASLTSLYQLGKSPLCCVNAHREARHTPCREVPSIPPLSPVFPPSSCTFYIAKLCLVLSHPPSKFWSLNFPSYFMKIYATYSLYCFWSSSYVLALQVALSLSPCFTFCCWLLFIMTCFGWIFLKLKTYVLGNLLKGILWGQHWNWVSLRSVCTGLHQPPGGTTNPRLLSTKISTTQQARKMWSQTLVTAGL